MSAEVMTMSKRKFTLRAGLKEFASTFREWHYFVGGFALGVLAGIEYARRALR
jgi:hypothetical protein